MKSLRVLDSHTEGEPTRIVIEGLPDLGPGTAADRAAVFRRDFDGLRRAIVQEPRGYEAVVGGLLLEPNDPEAVAQVIFFNNVSTLNMCVHGTIGLAVTLRELGRIGPGRHRIETPVGVVTIEMSEEGEVAVENVPSFRRVKDLVVQTPHHGTLVGDVAWGGNWFFLAREFGDDAAGLATDGDNDENNLRLEHLAWFQGASRELRAELDAMGFETGDGREVDHVEFFAPPRRKDCDSRNLVICPGGEYDRSPCGTGTSAKLACLAADAELKADELWRQESIIGSRFIGSYRPGGEADGTRRIVPTIRGQAWITAESTLRFDDDDPYREGIAR